jgi:hypothetical protein
VNGRELYAMYLSAHSGETGQRLGNFDALSTAQRMVWERLAGDVHEEIMNDLRERGVMWEPTS